MIEKPNSSFDQINVHPMNYRYLLHGFIDILLSHIYEDPQKWIKITKTKFHIYNNKYISSMLNAVKG